ncbi:MAG: hypothetical protein COB02_15095 [Candidatus Cloacimonadota bacterium]|nr:MAG: hypothetical protein COB02_15095 [Candidatus Cloacimonadota bacterium]
MQEKELKIILEKKQYIDLINTLSISYEAKIKYQENYYFDTLNYDYLKSKEMLRVRKTKEKTILTIKRNSSVKDGYFECEEIEKSFEKCVWNDKNLLRFIFDRDQTFIKNLDFVNLGCLKNLRTIFQTKDFKLEIDQSNFTKSQIHYELECETIDPEKLLDFLDNEGLLQKKQIIFQTESKFKRFLKYNIKNLNIF